MLRLVRLMLYCSWWWEPWASVSCGVTLTRTCSGWRSGAARRSRSRTTWRGGCCICCSFSRQAFRKAPHKRRELCCGSGFTLQVKLWTSLCHPWGFCSFSSFLGGYYPPLSGSDLPVHYFYECLQLLWFSETSLSVKKVIVELCKKEKRAYSAFL